MNKDTTSGINPQFNHDLLSRPKIFTDHIEEQLKLEEPAPHAEILNKLLEQFEAVDFKALAFPQVEQIKKELNDLDPESDQAKELIKQLGKLKVNTKHYLVLSIENVRNVAEHNRWGLCKNQEFIYLYNSEYWTHIDEKVFQKFLGEAAFKMGVPEYTAKFYSFHEQLLKQFLATEYFPTPEPPKEAVYINMKNGTFEITTKGQNKRPFDRLDFLTYQLPFEYNPAAKAPIFQEYLNKVLPDIERQKVLAEFLGFVFIKNGGNSFKEEKALILYGTGANGKSVFFEVVNALLGIENISTYSLQSLTDEKGYHRAMIANKLVNYASEINGKLETSIFKQLVSGEPVEARLPYGIPMQIKQYSKLIFNCNDLPKDIEHSHAYFRRFLIIPFDVTIPEHEQDKQLHTKIIENELSGVFNWVLEGLNRLLEQKRFSHCEAAKQAIEQYKTESNSVKQFMEENGYKSSPNNYTLIKDLFIEYRAFCCEDGCTPFKKQNFIKQLRGCGILIEKINKGNVAYLSKDSDPF